MKLGFTGILGLVFIALKLGGMITWSWWWVLAPIWGGFLAAIVLTLFAAWVLTR